MADVTRDRDRKTAARDNLLCGRSGSVRIAVRDHDGAALIGEAKDTGPADTLGAARDHDRLVCKPGQDDLSNPQFDSRNEAIIASPPTMVGDDCRSTTRTAVGAMRASPALLVFAPLQPTRS